MSFISITGIVWLLGAIGGIMPWAISGLHPERTGSNTMVFFPMEVAVGGNDPTDSIRFPSRIENVLYKLGSNGRDRGEWPAVVSFANTTWQFYACKETVGGQNPMIIASQSVSYSAVDFTSAPQYGPEKCRKLPFAAVYDVPIGWLPIIYNRDGTVLFSTFDNSARYTLTNLRGTGSHQVVSMAKLTPDAARNVLVHFDCVKSTGNGVVYAKPGSGVAGDGQPVAYAGSGIPSEVWLTTNSVREISVKIPRGYSCVVRQKGYRDSELP